MVEGKANLKKNYTMAYFKSKANIQTQEKKNQFISFFQYFTPSVI